MAQTVYDPPVSTYIPLQTITLGSAASSVTFASIPQTYRDLILVVAGGVTGSQGNNLLYFNGDTTAGNYSYVRMLGNGSAAQSATASNATVSDMTSAQNQVIIQIMDYSATDKHKTRLSRSDQSSSTVIAYASRWANTNAITSITFDVNAGTNWATSTTFSLYAIEA